MGKLRLTGVKDLPVLGVTYKWDFRHMGIGYHQPSASI